MLRHRYTPSHSKSALAVVAVLGLLGPTPAVHAQQPPEKATQVYRLQHVRAEETARVLREVFGDTVGAKARIRVSADRRTNSLIAIGAPIDLLTVAKVLERIDVPTPDADAPALLVELVRLRHLDPDPAVAAMLRLIVPSPSRFSIDRERRTVLLHARPEAIRQARLLLDQLDQAGSAQVLQFRPQVRIFWVVSAGRDDKTMNLPEPLQEIADKVEALGVSRPRLAGQLAAAVGAGVPFEVSGVVQLEAPQRLAVRGELTLAGDAPHLDVSIDAGSPAGKGSGGHLHTQLMVVGNRPVVCGVLPVEGRPSAFVAQVVAESPERPQGKKAAPKKAVPKKALSTPGNNNAVLTWVSDAASLPGIGPVLAVGPMVTDEKPAGAPARVEPGDLDSRPPAELVRTVLPLRNGLAEEMAGEVRKVLGPLGQVVAIRSGNALVVMDTAGNLRAVRDLVAKAEAGQEKRAR
jgi:hypothetical protein